MPLPPVDLWLDVKEELCTSSLFTVTLSGAAYYGALAAQGIDVYLYDQVGSGYSARLTDPWDYTVDRHVADLEAIRQRIGAERVMLLGDSWGATLVANYMAVHGEHVARVIFTSPGAISRADWPESLTPASRISADEQRRSAALFEHPRFRLWRLLLRDVKAAYRFIPEAELDGFTDRIVGSFLDRVATRTTDGCSVRIGIGGSGSW